MRGAIVTAYDPGAGVALAGVTSCIAVLFDQRPSSNIGCSTIDI
jgi:hypothetical protein